MSTVVVKNHDIYVGDSPVHRATFNLDVPKEAKFIDAFFFRRNIRAIFKHNYNPDSYDGNSRYEFLIIEAHMDYEEHELDDYKYLCTNTIGEESVDIDVLLFWRELE